MNKKLLRLAVGLALGLLTGGHSAFALSVDCTATYVCTSSVTCTDGTSHQLRTTYSGYCEHEAFELMNRNTENACDAHGGWRAVDFVECNTVGFSGGIEHQFGSLQNASRVSSSPTRLR
jgi:hypothetical protein